MKTTQLQLLNNYVLILPHGSYDRVKIAGGVELAIGYNHVDRGRHYSITGKVLKLPKKLTYHSDLLKDVMDQEERISMVDSSLPWKTTLDLRVGDMVVYNYMQNDAALIENRIVEIEGYGDCLLLPYEEIYGYSRDGKDYTPINGFVFFRRDIANSRENKGDLEIVLNTTDYQEDFGSVIDPGKPVPEYLDGRDFDKDPDMDLKAEDRILVKTGYGFRISYEYHEPSLKGVEVIRRPNILALCPAS